jgi:hypothetical protein
VLRTLLLATTSAVFLFAATPPTGDAPQQVAQKNQIDGNYSSPQGWIWNKEFNATAADNEDALPSEKLSLVEIFGVMKELLEVNKEQLEVQKEIRDILKEQYDPSPKIVKRLDGTECVANSSADCYVHPLTAEAKRIPVLMQYLSAPSLQSAGEYIRWQSKYFNHISDGAAALVLADRQWGSKVNTTGSLGETHNDVMGTGARMIRDAQKEVIKKIAPNLKIKILVGVTPEVEVNNLINVVNIEETFADIGIDTQVVAPSKEYVDAMVAHAKAVGRDLSTRGWENIIKNKLTVDLALFEEFDPDSTPYSILAYDDGEKQFTHGFAVAKDNADDALTNLFRALLLNNVVERVEIKGAVVWKHYKDRYIKENSASPDTAKTLDELQRLSIKPQTKQGEK